MKDSPMDNLWILHYNICDALRDLVKVRLVDNINDLNETEYYDNCMYYKKKAFADGMKDSPMDNLWILHYNICDALRDLVPFVLFEKREKALMKECYF